jgi:hypothetical protein
MGTNLPKTFTDKATMTCDQISLVFNASAALAMQENRGLAHQPQFGHQGQPNGFSKAPKSAAELNEMNAKFYERQAIH